MAESSSGPPTNNLLPGISNAVAVAANGTFALVLRADGTVAPVGLMDRWFWGFTPESTFPAYVPAGLTNVVAVAAGGLHALALRSDGTVTPWVAYVHHPQCLCRFVATSCTPMFRRRPPISWRSQPAHSIASH